MRQTSLHKVGVNIFFVLGGMICFPHPLYESTKIAINWHSAAYCCALLQGNLLIFCGDIFITQQGMMYTDTAHNARHSGHTKHTQCYIMLFSQ